MIKVSEKYLELSKDEYNNYQHRYKIINLTRNNMDLEPLLISESLRVNRFLRTAQGTLTPNNVNLQFEGKQGTQQDFLVKDFWNKYKDFPHMRWKDIVTIEFIEEYLIKNQDIIEIIDTFNDETITVFKGQVREVKRTDTDNRRTIDITIEDNTIKGYENTFGEEKVYENYYISNNSDKEKSILHVLARQIGFNDNELHIVDIKDTKKNYIQIPLIKCKKGDKIMTEIAEIVRAVYGNIYTLPNGELKITSELDKSYLQDTKLTIGSKNGNYPTLSFIENVEIQPKENKAEVKYNNIVKQEKQAVFVLSGQNADFKNDDAKIKVSKNSKGSEWWKVEFNNVINIDKTPKIKAYKLVKASDKDYKQEEVEYSEFELIWEENSQNAKLKFNNSKDYDIFIKEFKIYGNPLLNFKDNSVLYTEIKGLKDYNIKQVSNRYINSKELATEIAKHTYYNECRPYSRVKLQTNNMPFLELEDIVHLDYNKYKGDYQIIAITQTNEYTELLLKLYREYQAYGENFITEIIAKNNKGLIEPKVNITKEEKEKISENDKAIKELKTIVETLQANTNTKLDKISEQISAFTSFLEEYKKIEPKLNKIIANFKEVDYMTKNEALTALQNVTNKKEFDTLFNSKRIKRMIVNNQDLMLAISKNDTILNIMYDNYKKINSGARQSVSGGKYIILEVSGSNAYSSSYGETRRNGSTLSDWGSYKGKFQYFKNHPNYVDYIRNDTESNDWVYYYDFEI